MAKVLVNKLGVFGGQFLWRSVGRGQLTRGQFAAVSCRVLGEGSSTVVDWVGWP